MRLAAFGFELRACGGIERGAIVDRRQAARPSQAALTFQFNLSLIGGIDVIRRLQLVESDAVFGEAIGLAVGHVMRQAQPAQIAVDRLLELFRRTRRVSVVNAQNELTACLLGEQVIQQRGAGVADMQQARGRRRETNFDRHRASRKALVMG